MIVDTNALSSYADGFTPVVRLIDAAPSVEIPVIVVGEYAFGIAGSRRARAYSAWLQKMLTFTTVLSITEETAAEYAAARTELKQRGTLIPANDLWIAALARQHQFPVLSRDRHFDAVKGLQRISW